MNIEGLSMTLAKAASQTQVGTAVMAKALDADRTMGQGVVEMIDAAAMERSVNPHIGGNVDYSV